MIQWKTERWPVEKLRDYDKNPRIITEKGLQDLEKSLKNLGYIDPIAINTDGTIIGGHARKAVLQRLGIDEVEVRVPNKRLTEKQVEQAIIRLNKNIAGQWDFDLLANAFDSGDLIDWGFTPDELGGFDGVGGDEQSSEGITDSIFDYFVIVQFKTESEQQEFFERMTNEGQSCKLMN